MAPVNGPRGAGFLRPKPKSPPEADGGTWPFPPSMSSAESLPQRTKSARKHKLQTPLKYSSQDFRDQGHDNHWEDDAIRGAARSTDRVRVGSALVEVALQVGLNEPGDIAHRFGLGGAYAGDTKPVCCRVVLIVLAPDRDVDDRRLQPCAERWHRIISIGTSRIALERGLSHRRSYTTHIRGSRSEQPRVCALGCGMAHRAASDRPIAGTFGRRLKTAGSRRRRPR